MKSFGDRGTIAMAWQPEEMKPGDRVAQAGITLVEQALFDDAMRLPNSFSGEIKKPDASGLVEINSAFPEYVHTMRQHDADGGIVNAKAYHENIDTVTDARGWKLQTIDEQEEGFLLDINRTNQFMCKTIVRDANGSLQYQLQGVCAATPKDNKFKDDAYFVFNGQGQQLPIRLELVGKATGPDSLTVTATTMLADPTGKIIAGTDGKPQILGTVKADLVVDPNNPTGARFNLKRTGTPLRFR